MTGTEDLDRQRPGGIAPDVGSSEGSPATSTPRDNSAPVDTAPSDTAPSDTAPSDTAPDGTSPEGAAPKEGPSDDTPDEDSIRAEQRVLVVSVTVAGARLAERLPWPAHHGSLGNTVRRSWGDVDALVLFCAAGVAVRVIAPLLGEKQEDPAVVCVDDSGRHVVALLGGHAADANGLARQVAAILEGHAVITTATDTAGLPALDRLPGWTARGYLAAVTRARLDGNPPVVEGPEGWTLPAGWAIDKVDVDAPVEPDEGAAPVERVDRGRAKKRRIIITDHDLTPEPGTLVLHPPSLVAGVGASAGAPADEIADLLEEALTLGGLTRASLAEVATIDLKATEPGIIALGLPMRCYPAAELAPMADRVPNPSEVVKAEVGTASVAEASALLAAGPGGELVVAKQRSKHATVALARRARPRGRLSLVGLGPGAAAHRTPAAAAAVRAADTVIGYRLYLDLCADLLEARHDLRPRPIGGEEDRCREALALAGEGRKVALVCSGDSGVYAMASLALELVDEPKVAADLGDAEIEVIPGVTAALSAAAVLGAPLGHDHASVSLSNLLTPWDVIEKRLKAVAEADFVLTIYNPRSAGRDWQLERARDLLLEHRPGSTPVGIVTDAGRPTQHVTRTTLADFDPSEVDMLTCVVIGASNSRWIAGRFVTPRGYRP